MSTTIGQQLSRARNGRGLTIEQAASATRIRVHYLRALETDDFGSLPSMVHARGFLRAYAEYLGLDPELLVGELEGKEETSVKSAPSTETQAMAQNREPAAQTRLDANLIFQEVGQQLRQRRELLGLSLDDVERHTHLRLHYLRALEAGDLEGLPSPVQGRGMLDNYASFLGMDSEKLMLLFADGLQAKLNERRATLPTSKPAPIRENLETPSFFRRLLSLDFLIGGSLAILLVVFLMWGFIRIFTITTSKEQPTPTAPSIAEVLLATPTPTITFTPPPATPTSFATLALFPTIPIPTGTITDGSIPITGASVQVYLTVQQRAWVRVTVDGKVQLEGRVLPGSAYPFMGDTQIEVLTGNGAGLQVFFNGVDQGLMGGSGQVVNLIYMAQGMLNPTATITLTPAATQPAPGEVTITPEAGTPVP